MSKQINDLRARYNANGNAIIPNTFQHPNIFVDKLMYYLTPEENTALTFATRRILGFQTNIMSRKDNISLSQFEFGLTKEDGTPLCMGCGLGGDAIRKVLQSLAQFRILIPTTEKPDPRRGQEYWLQDNENNIDWEGLEKRKEEKKEIEYKRTQKARSTVAQDTSGCTVAQEPRGGVAQDTSVLSDRNTKPTETHRNPLSGDKSPSAEFPMEWILGHGDQVMILSEEQEFTNLAKDSANLIDMGCAGAGDLALAFMLERKILIPEGKIKGNRKAAREMLQMHVEPNHVRQAVIQLIAKNLTVTDLFSISKTAIALANPAPEKVVEYYHEERRNIVSPETIAKTPRPNVKRS